MSNTWQSLCRPAVYRVAIERLLRRAVRDDDGELALLRRDRDALARHLASEMASRTWRPGAVTRKVVLLDKPRELVRMALLDRIVHAAVASELAARTEPTLPDSLYSYRPRRGPLHVVRAVLGVVRRQRDLPLTRRGLFVMRFDIKSYGDSVPLDDGSELWPALDARLAGEDPWFRDRLRAMIRGEANRALGVPTGSPLANPLLNLYLADLDRTLETIATCYVRFGDDCLVLCGDEATSTRARAEIEAVLARKRLQVNDAKFLQTYWSGPGRPGPTGWRGTSHVAYLGVEIGFSGVVRIKTARRRALIRGVRERIETLTQCLGAAGALPADVRARAALLCEGLRPLFDVRSPFVLPEIPIALGVSSCRIQLAELDREIAVAVASAAARRPGPSAFRAMPWRTLHELGLPSLVAMRNRGRR